MARRNKGSGRGRSNSPHPNDPTRTADGRFGKGHCPNRAGRPPKDKRPPGEGPLHLLDREVTLADGSSIPMGDYIMMGILNAARDNPRLALEVIKLRLQEQRSRLLAPGSVDESAEDDPVLDAFSERLKRQQRRAGGDAASELEEFDQAGPEGDRRGEDEP